MAALLRHRRVVRDVKLELPDGSSRLVKVTTEDHRHVQHVEDWQGRVHGTGCPQPSAMVLVAPERLSTGRGRRRVLRGMRMPRGTQAFARQDHDGPWVPVPGTLEAVAP